MMDLMIECIDVNCAESPPVSTADIPALQSQIPEWQTVDVDGVPRLRRTYRFGSYPEVLAFVQRVGELAENEGHHPVITAEWGKVRVSWWTHSTKGLLRNDFIMAAKTDTVYDDGREAIVDSR